MEYAVFYNNSFALESILVAHGDYPISKDTFLEFMIEAIHHQNDRIVGVILFQMTIPGDVSDDDWKYLIQETKSENNLCAQRMILQVVDPFNKLLF